MDYTLQADSEHRILLVTLGERVTEASALAAYSAVERFNAAQGAHSGVTDLSKVERLDVSTDFVRRLAAKPPMIPDGMSRVVVASRPAIYGLSRMFQILRENRDSYLEVAHTLNEAFQLLNLSEPSFRTVVLAPGC